MAMRNAIGSELIAIALALALACGCGHSDTGNSRGGGAAGRRQVEDRDAIRENLAFRSRSLIVSRASLAEGLKLLAVVSRPAASDLLRTLNAGGDLPAVDETWDFTELRVADVPQLSKDRGTSIDISLRVADGSRHTVSFRGRAVVVSGSPVRWTVVDEGRTW